MCAIRPGRQCIKANVEEIVCPTQFSQQSSGAKCEECEASVASVRCGTCGTKYCSVCFQQVGGCCSVLSVASCPSQHQVHSTHKTLRLHTAVPLDDMLFCAKHTQQLANEYCMDCEQLICLLCSEHHKHHSLASLETAVRRCVCTTAFHYHLSTVD